MAPNSGIRYTPEQLQFLKDSPLVRKPDRLPSIAQWMPQEQDQNTRKARPLSTSENDTTRPSLLNTRHFARTSTGTEDIVLGPPKFAFTSASAIKTLKTTDADKGIEDEATQDRFAQRSTFFKERDAERQRDKQGFANGRRGPREEGESWSNNRTRRTQDPEDEDRFGRNHGRDRDPGDADETQPRRNGAGRGRFDRPWGRDENQHAKDSESNRVPAARAGGWREREREKERKDDRDWHRGAKLDEEPEWMGQDSGPMEKKQPKTPADFIKWMEEMKNKTAGREQRETTTEAHKTELQPAPNALSQPVGVTVATDTANKSVPPTPFSYNGSMSSLFGTWGDTPAGETADSEGGVAVKPILSKAKAPVQKASRFKSLFKEPQDENFVQQPPPPPPEISSPAQEPEPADERADFARVMQMLQATKMQPSTENVQSPASRASNDMGALDFLQARQTERLEGPNTRMSPAQGKPDRSSFGLNLMDKSQQSPFGFTSPPNHSAWDSPRAIQPQRTAFDETFQQPPSRNPALGDSTNLQTLLGARQPLQDDAQKREFLLRLIQQQTPTPSQTPNSDLSRMSQEQHNGSMYVGERGTNMQMPKARGPPAGFVDLNDQDLFHRTPELNTQNTDQFRKTVPRPPPGLYEDASLGSHAPRRTTNEQQNRSQMSNMGIPQQPDPNWLKFQGLQPQQDRLPPPPPPPGFPSQTRITHQGGPQFPQNLPFLASEHSRGPPPGLQRNVAGSGHAYNQMPPPPPPPPPPGYFQGPGGPPGHNSMPPNFPGMMGHPEPMMGPPPRSRIPTQQHGFDMYGDIASQRSRGGPQGPYM